MHKITKLLQEKCLFKLNLILIWFPIFNFLGSFENNKIMKSTNKYEQHVNMLNQYKPR